MTRALVIAVALIGSACRDDELAHLEDVKSEICACKTTVCGEAAMKKVPASTPQGDGALRSSHRAQQLAKQIMECLARLYAETRPTTDPDVATPGSTSPGSSAPASAEKP
jgi:hypothetical protein